MKLPGGRDPLPRSFKAPTAGASSPAKPPEDRDVDREDRGRRPVEPSKLPRIERPTGAASFAQRVLDLVTGRPAVGVVLLAASLPGIAGCGVTGQTPVRTPTLSLLQAESPEALGKAAIADQRPVDPAHDYARHVRAVRADLATAKLPARADGVRVWVVDDVRSGGHAARVIGSPEVGIAPGADVRLVVGRAFVSDTHREVDRAVERGLARLRAGDGGPDDDLIIDLARLSHLDLAASVRFVTGQASGKTELVTLSRAESPRTIARRLLGEMEAASPGSATAKALGELGKDGPERLAALTKRVVKTLDDARGTRLVGNAAWTFEQELSAAREKNVLVFAGAGDAHEEVEGTREWSASLTDGTEQLLSVGGATLGDPADPRDGASTSTSSKGWIDLAAPGWDVPVGGTAEGLDQRGTRLSSAYAAGVAALMVRANPALGPTDLEALLTSRGVVFDVGPHIRDGAGVLDPVGAVRAAEGAKTSRAHLAASRAHLRATRAMRVHAEVAPDHAYKRHVDGVRAELAKRGLPTSADGVRVFVVEPSWGRHAGAVLRTIADPEVGLAKGADVSLHDFDENYGARGDEVATASSAARAKIREGKDPLSTGYAEAAAEISLWQRAADIREIRKLHDGKSTALMNTSYGTTAFTIAERIIDSAKEAPAGSPAAELLRSLPEDEDARLREVARRVHDRLSSKQVLERLAPARQALTDELALARSERLLVVTSAGNSYDAELPGIGASAHIEDGFEDLIVVGATKINDPATPKDDEITDFSSEGAISVAAPGHQIPVGLYGNMNGTSFASPYTVATAALMLAANPALTPDALDAILKSPGVATDVAGDRDGAGVIDPVAAVAAAKARAAGP